MIMSPKHQEYMQQALNLAKKAKGKTSPNPIVGCVVVKAGRVIGEGYHRRAGLDHAEIVALKKCGAKARGATLYVTLEPCFHVGRTPPCVKALIASGVKKVYIGIKDPNPLTGGKSIALLRRSGVEVSVGLLKAEIERANEDFISYITKRRPFIAIKSAQTLDGKIATRSGESKWITSQATRQKAYRIRDQYDAILVGVNTVLKDNPRLNGFNKKRVIKKIILDSSLKTSLPANLFKGSYESCYVAVTKKASQRKIKAFISKGVHVIVCPSHKDGVDIKWLLKDLAKKEIMSILVEGGAKVCGAMLKSKCVDKMYTYIAPKIIGDHQALSSIDGNNISKLVNAFDVTTDSIETIGKDVLITSYVYRNH